MEGKDDDNNGTRSIIISFCGVGLEHVIGTLTEEDANTVKERFYDEKEMEYSHDIYEDLEEAIGQPWYDINNLSGGSGLLWSPNDNISITVKDAKTEEILFDDYFVFSSQNLTVTKQASLLRFLQGQDKECYVFIAGLTARGDWYSEDWIEIEEEFDISKLKLCGSSLSPYIPHERIIHTLEYDGEEYFLSEESYGDSSLNPEIKYIEPFNHNEHEAPIYDGYDYLLVLSKYLETTKNSWKRDIEITKDSLEESIRNLADNLDIEDLSIDTQGINELIEKTTDELSQADDDLFLYVYLKIRFNSKKNILELDPEFLNITNDENLEDENLEVEVYFQPWDLYQAYSDGAHV